MNALAALRTKIFGDGADLPTIAELSRLPYIRGFTTNPTLMRKAGVRDYASFAREAIAAVEGRPISFEVLSDDFAEMERQARVIASWGGNVYVKIPITNTRRDTAGDLIRRLSRDGVKVNVTGVLTLEQVEAASEALRGGAPANISFFAGRVADTGRDPVPLVTCALRMLETLPQIELIWASPRELLNIVQASELGCPIITVTNDILKKLTLVGKNLNDFSAETVQMFVDDARGAGYTL
jgi:transaldolase